VNLNCLGFGSLNSKGDKVGELGNSTQNSQSKISRSYNFKLRPSNSLLDCAQSVLLFRMMIERIARGRKATYSFSSDSLLLTFYGYYPTYWRTGQCRALDLNASSHTIFLVKRISMSRTCFSN
jgi:hypothetical protein